MLREFPLRLPLLVLGILLCQTVAVLAGEAEVSCLVPEGRLPGPTHLAVPQEFEAGNRAFENNCWEEMAACMCKAEERLSENGARTRVYDRWFSNYLPRHGLGVALYRLGCYRAALTQFESSVLYLPTNLPMTEKERGNLLDFHEKARTKVEQTIMKREGADCDLWQAEAPELEPPPPTTALVCQPEPVDCSVAPRSDSP